MWWIHDTSRGTWAMATPAAASSSHCGMPPGAEDGRPFEALLGGKVWRGEADDRAMCAARQPMAAQVAAIGRLDPPLLRIGAALVFD